MRDFIIDQIRETLEQDVFPRLSKAKARVALALLVLGADASQAEVAEWVGCTQDNVSKHMQNNQTDGVHIYDRLLAASEGTDLLFWLRLLQRYPDSSTVEVNTHLIPWDTSRKWGRGYRIFAAPKPRGVPWKARRR